MTIIEHTPTPRRHSIEGVDIARPTWAEETRIDDDLNSSVIVHSWTAPVLASGFMGGDETSSAMTVEVSQIDNLVVQDAVVRYHKGPARISLTWLDASFEDTAEARRFAAAILACCDRLDTA